MNTLEKCPRCGSGPLGGTSSYARYECLTVTWKDNGHIITESPQCRINQLTARVLQLEAVVTDPHALWSNWLRGTVKLPAGIGDVRQCSEKMKRFRSRWLAAHQELRRTEDTVERARELESKLTLIAECLAADLRELKPTAESLAAYDRIKP